MNFDGISDKFDKNIYGTTKGRLRHDILITLLLEQMQGSKLKVLDLGGGTGQMSLAFARLGHELSLVDVSTDALNIAKERLKDFPQCHFHCADVMNTSSHQDIGADFDLVICHAMLEWLETPFEFLPTLSHFVKDGGIVSLSFFNQHAKLFSNLLYANFDYVEKGMPNKNTVRLNPHYPLVPNKVLEYFQSDSDYTILSTHGVRCIHDYISDKHRIESQYQKLLQMELKYGSQEPYKSLGKYFHIMLERHN